MTTEHVRARRALSAVVLAVGLLFVPAPAFAEEPTPPPPTPAPPPEPTPEDTPPPVDPTPEPETEPTEEPGGEPMEEDPGKKPSKPATDTQQRQAQADLVAEEAKAKAKAAAEKAVAEARAKYQQALAKDRVARFKVRQLRKQSEAAAAKAATLRREIGNLARLAYTSGDSELAMIEVLLENDPDSQVLAGIQAARQAAAHKDVRLAQELTLRVQADELRAAADLLAEETAMELAEAKAELRRAESLAKSVELAIAPMDNPPPVNLDVTSDWVFPTATGQIDSEAGMRMHPILGYARCHAGADISAASGTPIYAVDDGVVLTAGVNGGYGNYTLIAHGGGMSSAYAHQSVIIVKPGSAVTKGQMIGHVGTTGLSTGPHLHFEARYHGVPYNPRGWLEDHPELRTPAC